MTYNSVEIAQIAGKPQSSQLCFLLLLINIYKYSKDI